MLTWRCQPCEKKSVAAVMARSEQISAARRASNACGQDIAVSWQKDQTVPVGQCADMGGMGFGIKGHDLAPGAIKARAGRRAQFAAPRLS